MINKIKANTYLKNNQTNKSNPSFEAMTLKTKLPDRPPISVPCDTQDEMDVLKKLIEMINNKQIALKSKLQDGINYYTYDLKIETPENEKILLKLPRKPDLLNPKIDYIVSNENTYQLAQASTETYNEISFFYSTLINGFKNLLGLPVGDIKASSKSKIINFPNK